MKNIIERIVGGVKIARYLPKAVSTRLAVAALATLAASGAWATAPTATVVWESDFGTTKTVDGSTFAIAPNSASLDGNGNLAIGASTGNTYTSPTLAIPAAFQSDKITVLIKYSGLAAYSGANAALSSVKAEYGGSSIVYGLRSNGSGHLDLIGYNESNSNVQSLGSTVSLGTGAGYYLVSTDTGVGVYGYTGTHVKGLSGSSTALKMDSNYKVTSVSLGGSHGVGKAYAWAGVTIEKVAIFIGNAYSNTDLAEYVWPSSKYAKWVYANNVYTWVPSKDSSDIGASSNGTLYQFDVASGEDTSTTLASGGNNWKQFCIGQTQYSAPGCALRFTSSSANKTFTGGFNPFTFGGIIVESDAGGLSIGTTSDTTRTTVFGADSGTTETWFRFDADASVKRGGAFRFSGNVNLDIASGKTLSLAAAGSPAIVASVNDNQMATTAGGTLRVHGGGKLAATLNASGAALDFSDQPTASASTTSAYIQGALTVDEDTTFTFPTGATFPYFVATSISGDIDYTSGYKANADGSISEVASLSITTTDAVDLPTTWTSSDDAIVIVAENIDATLNVTEAATLSTMTFYVPATSTLTISGSAITASTIYFPRTGIVKVSAAGALVGTAKGSGTLQYSGVLPNVTSGISFSNAAWTGTMWLKDFGSVASSKVQGNLTSGMANWGNSGSKVKFTNVKAYAPDSNVTAAWTLVLEDGSGTDEYAWRCDNGYSNNTVTFGGLSGTGTFYDQGTVTSKFTFNSFDGFTGKFDIASTGHQIAMPASATLTVAQNSSIRFGSQGMLGTLNIPANVTLTSTGSDAVSYNTGSSTVNVYGTLDFGTTRWTLGPNTVVNLYEGAIVQGTGDSNNSNAAMDFNVANGSTIHAIGNATVSCTIRNNEANGTAKINVDEGKTLTFSGNLVGNYGFKKQGAGVLKLTGSVANFPAIDAGTVLLGGNKSWDMGTLRDFTGYTLEEGSSIAITQTKAEYGSGVTTVTGVASSIVSITVNKPDGTTATITPASGTGTLSETAVVSGSAVCNHDYEFNNAWTDAGSDQKDAKTWDSAEPNFLQDGETSNWSVYTAVCPGNENTFNLSGDWSAAIRCTVPRKANGVIVAFGNNSSFVALAAGATENTARLVKGGGDGAVTELATMSVAHATTAMHVYAFVKTDNAMDIYCDGTLVTRYNGAVGNLSDGFQFGTVRSVEGNILPAAWGIVRLNNSEKDTGGNVDYMRIYNFAITSEMIAKLHTDHPYVSPSTAFTRTLAGESGLEWSAADAWTKGGETAVAPDADGKVELTASADSTIAANLSEAAIYETLTFKGEGAITVTKATGGATLSAVEVAIDTDTTVAADAVDFMVSRVAVAAGKTLTFDVSGIASANGNWANAASVERIRLTGLATLGASATVAVTPTTAGYWNLSVVEDGGYWYLSVAPNRASGSIYWQSGTYWNSTYNLTGSDPDNPAVFTTDAEGQTPTKYFAGDTVIIPTTTKRYFGPISDGAAIRFDCNGAIEVTKTDSLGYVFKNATVTVASGTTLNFVNSWNGASPEVYGGTISGAGKVQVASGITLTLSNGATIAAATALTGAGTVNFATVPTAQMTFDNWTGTVKLPQFAADGAKLTFAGNAVSTVALTGITSGWLGQTSTQRSDVAPTLRLDGDVTITGMSSSWSYSFAKITGTGNLSFTSTTAPSSLAITEIADYTGTLNNSTTTALTVGRISLASAPAADTLLLATNGTGTVTVNAVYVNGANSGMQVVYKEGGVYSPPATYVAEYGGVQYETVQEAINAAVQAGQTYAAVTILDPTAECPDEYYVDNGTLKKKPAAVCTAGTLTYYTTIELAMQAANQAAYMAAMGLGTDYDYVIFFENAAVTQMLDGMKIKQVAGVTVTVATSSAEFTSTPGAADAEGIVTYALANAPTAYTWTDAYFAPDPQTGESVEDHRWSSAGNWSFGSGTTATRYPQSGDTVSFSSASTVTLDANAACASMTIAGCAVSISADSAKTLAAGTISLTAAESSISVTDVTLSPVPTTEVADSYVKTTTSGSTTTYTVATQPTVSDVAFDYGDDFATATVTATVSDAAPSYKLTVGGTEYPGVVSGSKVTFSNVATGRTAAYDDVSYEIAATSGSTAVPLAGDTSGSAEISDTKAWFSHDSSALTGGTWATAVDLSEPATVEDNTFTAAAESTSSRVVLEFNVCFSSASDADVDGAAQAAIKIGEVESAATFMVLAPNSSWTPVSNADLTPDAAKTYKVVMTIDYGSNTYKVDVGGCSLTNASGSASFPLAASKKSVQTIGFAGSGTLTSMKGDQVEGYMVKDNAGNWYATIQDATQAYNSANGPYTVLHDGTAPSGWKIDGNTLIKLAKGFFFMAY